MTMLLAVSACGGDGGGSNNPPGNQPPKDATPATVSVEKELTVGQAIVLTFSESMKPDSLSLGGSLAALTGNGEWSSNAVTNDTLTLTPSTSWNSGVQTLGVTAKDVAGNVTKTGEMDFDVRLLFENFQAAQVVVGQPDFISNDEYQGGEPTANSIGGPYGNPAFDSTTGILFLSDFDAHRVLAFNGIPTQNDALADFVLGQPDFTSSGAGTTETSFTGPQSLTANNGKFVLSEYTNHRISIYNGMPQSGPGVIDVVVGQTDKESDASGCTVSGLSNPETHFVTPDGKLLVTDSDNNRVLIWNTLPMEDGVAADLVLGQSTLTNCILNDDNQDGNIDEVPGARTFSYPAGIWTDGTRIVVLDNDNNRVLIWNTFPTQSFTPADVVLGQADFTHAAPNDTNQDGVSDATPSARTFNGPYDGVYSNGLQLFVADTNNNRVLIWNTFPTENFVPADVVLGQSDFIRGALNDVDQDGVADLDAAAQVLSSPVGLLIVEDKLIVNDSGNSRYLIFKSR